MRVGTVGQRLGFTCLADDLEPVAEPLHHRARDEDRAFERVGGFAFELVGDGSEQAVLRAHGLVPGVEQGKAAGAVGGFHHAGRKAGLADGGGLLIARDAEDRNLASEKVGAGGAIVGGAVAHLGEHGHRHVQQVADGLAPPALADVVKQCAGGVGGVGGVGLAAGQLPD